jgi:hypothetical protein
MPSRRQVAAAQAAFYAATGVWPLVAPRAFQRATGPKADMWLAKTVGLMVSVSAAALASAARHDRVTPELRLLGAGAAASLAAVDVWYVARGRIAPVYLIDALAEAALVAAWARAREGADLDGSAPPAAPVAGRAA